MERQDRNIDVDTAEVVYELPLLLVPGVVFTLIFLHLDSVCCCCRCLLLPAAQVSVYDPSNQGLELVLRGGRVVQLGEEEVVEQTVEQVEDGMEVETEAACVEKDQVIESQNTIEEVDDEVTEMEFEDSCGKDNDNKNEDMEDFDINITEANQQV